MRIDLLGDGDFSIKMVAVDFARLTSIKVSNQVHQLVLRGQPCSHRDLVAI